MRSLAHRQSLACLLCYHRYRMSRRRTVDPTSARARAQCDDDVNVDVLVVAACHQHVCFFVGLLKDTSTADTHTRAR